MIDIDKYPHSVSSFLLKAWEIYCKHRKGLSKVVVIYLTCCLPIPSLNILYWALKFISFLFERYELSFLHGLLEEFISIYYTTIPVWVFIIVSIIIALFFIAYIYSRFVDKKRIEFEEKAHGCNITVDFFKQVNDCSIAGLKERYSPQIHIHNPQLNLLYDLLTDSSETTESIKKQIKDLKNECFKTILDLESSTKNANKEVINKINSELQKLNDLLKKITDQDKQLNTGWFDELFEVVNIIKYIYKTELSENRYSYNEIREKLNTLLSYSRQGFYHILNKPTIAVIGEAGIGKSHLLADIVKYRKEKGYNSLFLLGQSFSSGRPIREQIKELLSIKCSFEEFLSVLNNYANVENKRIYIIIDALNEGDGHEIWPNEINRLSAEILNYDFLGLIVSCRKFQEPDAIINCLKTDSFFLYEHKGFDGFEIEASEQLFSMYNIPYPSWPVLNKSFYNPLFLKIYCESYLGQDFNLDGGFITIILRYIDKINFEVSKKTDYSANLNLPIKIALSLAKKMLDNQSIGLNYDEALSVADSITKQYYKGNFLELLIKENLFICYKRVSVIGIENWVVFNFQLFDDYLKAKVVVDSGNINIVDFAKGGSGVSEAGALLVPSIHNKELFEYGKNATEIRRGEDLFLGTLSLRFSLTNIGARLIENLFTTDIQRAFLFTGDLIYKTNTRAFAWELDKHLRSLTLPIRDQIWSIYLAERVEYSGNPYHQLMKWCIISRQQQISNIEIETIRSIANTLTWCLSTPNRMVRDLATKALVNILQNNISILVDILNRFTEIDDPYIRERIYAVAMGCAYRTNAKEELKDLSLIVYNNIFNKEIVLPDILLRDYARNTVEYTLRLGYELEIQIDKIRPPYKSYKWSINDCPSNEYVLENYKLDYQKFDRELAHAQNSIIDSLTVEHSLRGMYGDFGRYVFQAELSNWDIDFEALSNYALKLIFEKYGYRPDLFIYYEKNTVSHDRQVHKGKERIGKKYQWIAKSEILALVTDNYPEMSSDLAWRSGTYKGTWNPMCRDIDPTVTTANVFYSENSKINKPKMSWEQFSKYKFRNIEFKKWQSTVRDFRKDMMNDIIRQKDDKGNIWVKLYGYTNIYSDEHDVNDRLVWIFIQAYFVDKNDFRKCKSHIYRKGTAGRSMPEIRNNLYEYFYKEYYQSVAFDDYLDSIDDDEIDYNNKVGVKFKYSYLPFGIIEQIDGSLQEAISYNLPCADLVTVLNLKMAEQEGVFVDSNDIEVCFDPCAKYDAKGSLFIREDYLNAYLEKTNQSIIWPVIGEKAKSDHSSYEQFGGICYYSGNKIKYLFKPYLYRENKYKKFINRVFDKNLQDQIKLIHFLLIGNDNKRSQLYLKMLFSNKKPSSLYSFLRNKKGKNVDSENDPVSILFKDMDFDVEDNDEDRP